MIRSITRIGDGLRRYCNITTKLDTHGHVLNQSSSLSRIGEGLPRHYEALAGIQGKSITPKLETRKYSLNQHDVMNHSRFHVLSTNMFTLAKRTYCDTVKTSDSVDNSIDVHRKSLQKLLEKNQIKAALRYMEFNLKCEYVMSKEFFTDFVSQCYRNRGAKKQDKTLVTFTQKFLKNDQNFYPSWELCGNILDMSVQAQNSELASYALNFIQKFIYAAKISEPHYHYFVKEELIISVLQLAEKSRNIELLRDACILLDHSLNQNVPRAETFIAKICAYASLGEFDYAHASLFKLEFLYRGATQEANNLFSPFSALQSLVLAYSLNGCATLDDIYYHLEDLIKENPRYNKSLAALNCLILGCANMRDAVRAWQTFEAIGTTFGLIPDIDSYNCLIYAYFKGDEREEALLLFEDFINLGVKPNAKTYELLLDAHVTARDSKSALSTIEEMVVSGLEPTKKVLKKIYSCAIMEKDAASKDHVRALAMKFNISMSSKVLGVSKEYAQLAPSESDEELPKSSWEHKFKFRAKKVSLRRTRKVEARRKQQGKRRKFKHKWSRRSKKSKKQEES